MAAINPEFAKKVGERLRKARLEKNMSQAELAEKAHMSLPLISDLELGKKGMHLHTFVALADALEVSTDYILRTNAPEVTAIYQNEVSELLSDCSPEEMEAIIKIVKEVKKTIKSKQ